MTKLSIPNAFAEAVKVQHAILSEAEAHGYSESARFAIRLALDEAMSNAICHGNRNDPHKRIAIDYAVTDEQVRIQVTDEGHGFRPAAVPDPTLDENLERPHGRGIMLMRAYMTDVSYSERGNTVTLIKNRNCKLPER